MVHAISIVPEVGGLRPLLPWRAALRAAARPWVIVLVVVALTLGFFCAAYANWEMFGAPRHDSIQGVDDTGYYIWLRSVVIDGDLHFANDLASAPTFQAEEREEWLAAPLTKTGLVANKYPPGWALVTLPAFLAGHVVALLSGQPADGWSPPYFGAVWIYHLALAVLGLWWAWRFVARFVREDFAAASVLALWIASPVIYYHTGRVSMAHGLLFTLLAGLFHCTAAMPATPRAYGRWLLIGALGGLAVLVRATAVVYLVFPVAVLFDTVRTPSGPGRWQVVAAFALPGIAAASLLAACNLIVSGALVTEPYPGESFHWLQPAVFSSLLSARHGLFYWHPLILVGLAGLIGAMIVRAVPRVWAVSVVAIVYLNSAWHAWWFGSSFGNRAYEGVVLLAMVGLGWLFARAAQAPTRTLLRSLAGLTTVAVVAGAILLVLFVVQAIPREDPVTYGDMAAALFSAFGR